MISLSEVQAGVTTITMHGRDPQNYLYTDDLIDLAEKLELCAADPTLKALIVKGPESHFCGGRVGKKGLTQAGAIAEDLNAILRVNAALDRMPGPVLVAVEGQAFGFGFGVVAQSDFAIVSESSTFSLPEMSHGFPPLIVFSYLFRFISYKSAFDLSLTSRAMGASEAKDIGLVTTIVPAGQAFAEAVKVAEMIAGMDRESLSLFRRFARRMTSAHSPAISEEAVARMSVLLADRSVVK